MVGTVFHPVSMEEACFNELWGEEMEQASVAYREYLVKEQERSAEVTHMEDKD